MLYEQQDRTAGSGSDKGYVTVTHPNGDKSYLKFEGTNKLVKGGSAWKVSSEGRIWITGGTGKFKDMKGNGSYKGTATPKGSTINWEAEVQ